MKRPILIVAIMLLAVALAAAAYFLPVTMWTSVFMAWVRNSGTLGAFVYAIVYVVGTVLLLPGTALTAGSGFLYGALWGVLLVSPASVLGATIAFALARSFARDWTVKRIAKYPKFEAIDRAVEKHGFKIVLLLRLEPIFIPFAPLNYALGLTRVRLRDYVVASWIGMLPATILYVYLGSSVRNIAELVQGKLPGERRWHQLLFWSGLVIAVVIVFLLTRVAREALNKELERSPNNSGEKTA